MLSHHLSNSSQTAILFHDGFKASAPAPGIRWSQLMGLPSAVPGISAAAAAPSILGGHSFLPLFSIFTRVFFLFILNLILFFILFVIL